MSIHAYLLYLFAVYVTYESLNSARWPRAPVKTLQLHISIREEELNISHAQGERHSSNYKRKFDFKCKKIITFKYQFYTI